MRPLVSILIPCYNAQRWIGGATESVLAQTWTDREIIVVDDGSSDRSLDVIRSFEGRIRWETGPNHGGNAARNRLLELAQGRWVQYLDADDYLLPEKVAAQVAFLNSCPQADVIYGPVTLEHWSETDSGRELLKIPEPHDPWVLLARWYLPQTGAVLWRKQAVRDVGGWKTGQNCCQEHELYLRMLMAGKRFTYCPNNGAVYRQWGEHTVCKRNKPEVYRQRLEIEQRAEEYLIGRAEMTPERLWAINQARFEIARMVWLYDRDFAGEIVTAIRQSQPGFVPGGDAAPLHYRMLYRTLGFQATERLAAWKRSVLAPWHAQRPYREECNP
ncbi:MAG: glycosyltransferase [Acidobacteria bacterium]|nr:glycosyltransferase [Acidobacteriota bacterium]